MCNEVKIKANRKDDASTTFAGAERAARIEQQKGRLTGLRFRGEEECCHSAYDVTLNMLEKDCMCCMSPVSRTREISNEATRTPAKETRKRDINRSVTAGRQREAGRSHMPNCVQRVQAQSLGI